MFCWYLEWRLSRLSTFTCCSCRGTETQCQGLQDMMLGTSYAVRNRPSVKGSKVGLCWRPGVISGLQVGCIKNTVEPPITSLFRTNFQYIFRRGQPLHKGHSGWSQFIWRFHLYFRGCTQANPIVTPVHTATSSYCHVPGTDHS